MARVRVRDFDDSPAISSTPGRDVRGDVPLDPAPAPRRGRDPRLHARRAVRQQQFGSTKKCVTVVGARVYQPGPAGVGIPDVLARPCRLRKMTHLPASRPTRELRGAPMTPEFVEWLTDRGFLDSVNSAQEERLRAATETPRSPEQQRRWVEALADLVAEKWAATDSPPGLATARAAITFLRTEAAERDHWWRSPRIEIRTPSRTTSASRFLNDPRRRGPRSPSEMHPLDQSHDVADHDAEGCAECLKQFALQDAHIDEVRGTIASMTPPR